MLVQWPAGILYTTVIITGDRKIIQNCCYYENHPSRAKTQRSKHLTSYIHYIVPQTVGNTNIECLMNHITKVTIKSFFF